MEVEIPVNRDLLLSSLKRDAERIVENITLDKHHHNSSEEFAVHVYSNMRNAMLGKPGYPRIYKFAWTLLIETIRRGDWERLRDIDEIYFPIGRGGSIPMVDNISHWHHKAVFYCWAYLILDGDQIIGYRKRKEAGSLLAYVKMPTAFPNITPDEAVSILTTFEEKIEGFQTLRPYLFRLSLTYPGQFVLSYTRPYSTGIEHKHITSKQVDLLLYDRPNFYQALLSLMMPRTKLKNYSAEELFAGMEKMDSGADFGRLRKVLAGNRVIPKTNAIAILKEAYFSSSQPNIRVPLAEEVLGVTDSYKESYHIKWEAQCFQCKSSHSLTLKEPMCNRIYCDDECYNKNFKTCF